jgi:hypothetical protein
LPDGSFTLNMATNSTESASGLRTDCLSYHPRGFGLFRHYSADYTSLLDQWCMPIGTIMTGPSIYVFPQPEGDTIIIGTSETMGRGNDVAVERRLGEDITYSYHYGGGGTEAPVCVVSTPDGGFFVLSGTTSSDGDVGPTHGDDLFSADSWVVKLGADGLIQWSKALGGSGWDALYRIIPSADGGCYLFGATTSNDYDATGNNGQTDLWIVKMDSEGNKEWHKTLGGSYDDGGSADLGVSAISDGGSGFYIATRTRSIDGDVQTRMPMGDGPFNDDIWVLHVDSLANIIWENTFGGDGLQATKALCQATDGSLWVAGYNYGEVTDGHISHNYEGTDGWVVHLDTLGNFINQRTIGAYNTQTLDFLHPLPNGDVLSGGPYLSATTDGADRTPGFPNTGEGATDIFLVRLSPEDALSTEAVPRPSISWEVNPNPGSDVLNIVVPEKQDNYQIAVRTSDGQVIYKNTIRKSSVISCRDWASGTYFITLYHRGFSDTKKVSIQH